VATGRHIRVLHGRGRVVGEFADGRIWEVCEENGERKTDHSETNSLVRKTSYSEKAGHSVKAMLRRSILVNGRLGSVLRFIKEVLGWRVTVRLSYKLAP
jgi:hypothetical protein